METEDGQSRRKWARRTDINGGGRRRLSGFLPVQSVYADIFVIDDMWPEYLSSHFDEAIKWYQCQDVTLGG